MNDHIPTWQALLIAMLIVLVGVYVAPDFAAWISGNAPVMWG